MIVKDYTPLNKIGTQESILISINNRINKSMGRIPGYKHRKNDGVRKSPFGTAVEVIRIIDSGMNHPWRLKLALES